MASNYRIKISEISAANFYCPGCSDFADYVAKRGLTTYDNGQYVDLADLVTQHDLTSTALANTNAYHSAFKKNDNTVCRGVMKTNLNLCGHAAGYVSLPFYTGSDAVNPILAGTIPRFNEKVTLGPGTYSLELRNGVLSVNNVQITAEGDKPPLKILAVLQAGGGGGGGGAWGGVIYYNGAGGGSGAAAAVLLDLATQPCFTLTVGQRGFGGGGGYISDTTTTDVSNGRPGRATSIVASGTYQITCSGGQGGESYVGLPNGLTSCSGGQGGEVTYQAGGGIDVIATTSGVNGGNAKSSGGDSSGLDAFYGSSKIFSHTSYSSGSHAGDTNNRGGAASPHGNGNSGNNGTGGSGGAASLIDAHDGNPGGAGFIKLYY